MRAASIRQAQVVRRRGRARSGEAHGFGGRGRPPGRESVSPSDRAGTRAPRDDCLFGGFSLTELLVALAILALLSAAAMPLWVKQLERARRLDATDALVRIAVLQERFYFEHGRYAGAGELATPPPAGLGFGGTERGYYELRLRAAQGGLAGGFQVEAIARLQGPQAGDDQCRVLSLDSTGLRLAESSIGEDSTSECWP